MNEVKYCYEVKIYDKVVAHFYNIEDLLTFIEGCNMKYYQDDSLNFQINRYMYMITGENNDG